MDETRRQWVKRLAILFGTAAFLLVLVIVFREVLVPFVIAVVIAYVLTPAVDWFHRRKVAGRPLPRWTAVLIIYTVLVGLLTLFGTTLLPRLGEETTALVRAAPEFIQWVKDDWIPSTERWVSTRVGPFLGRPPPSPELLPEEEQLPPPPPEPALRVHPVEGGGFEVMLPREGMLIEEVGDGRYRVGAQRTQEPTGSFLGLRRQLDDLLDRILAQGEYHAVTAIRYTQRALVITVEFVFSAVLSLMLAAFILATMPAVMDFFRSLFPPRLRPDFDQLVKRVDRGLGGVVRGQLLICLINGVLSGIGFAIAGLRYWPVWTLVATVASIVPIFGTIVSSVPAIAIGLSQGWGTGLFVFIWIVAIHELEANIFNPKIMGDAAKMHPVIVVFALVAGANAAGILGALLGVPVASILQSLFRYLRDRAYGEEDEHEAAQGGDDPPPTDAEGSPEAEASASAPGDDDEPQNKAD